jgi:hypothetical protein
MRLSDLYQCTSWTTADGEKVRLDDMAVGHRVNLLRWLERRAEQLHQAEIMELCSFDEGCPSNVWDEDPLVWLHDTPLVRRLDELIEGDTAPRARAWLRNRWFHLRRAVHA